MPNKTKRTEKSKQPKLAKPAKPKGNQPAIKAIVGDSAALTPPLPLTGDSEVSDTASLPQCAQTGQERRTALDHALSGPWAAEDISMIRRVESGGRCLWAM